MLRLSDLGDTFPTKADVVSDVGYVQNRPEIIGRFGSIAVLAESVVQGARGDVFK